MKKNLLRSVFTFIVLFSCVGAFAQQSKVIVYRKGSIYGSLQKYRVNVDGTEMARLKNNGVYTFDIAPGSHTISPKNKKHAITLNTLPGKTYVVRYNTVLGLFGGRARLREVNLDQAKKESKKVKEMNMGMGMNKM
jgi:hypothetical protein